MAQSLLKVVWISFFPIELWPGIPAELSGIPPLHPATWQRVLLGELKQQPGLRIEIIAVRKHFPGHLSFESEGVGFHCLKVPAGMRTSSLFWWETLLIRRCLRRLKPDLIHAWGTERGAALVASRCKNPYLVTMQGLLEWYSQQVYLGPFLELEARLERASLRRAKVVTVESEFGFAWLRRRYPHLEIFQAEHAPDWVFHRIVRQPIVRPVKFLFVGTTSRIKGSDLLFRALDQLRGEFNFRLVVAGSPNPAFLASLKNVVSDGLWNLIDFRGNLPREEVAAELATATLMLFPSRADNSPNSVKEAAVAGLPVIASAIGGIPDYIRPNKNGILFKSEDLNGFVDAIRAALNHPLFSQGKVDPETLEWSRAYLSPHRMAESFLAAYKRVAQSRAS